MKKLLISVALALTLVFGVSCSTTQIAETKKEQVVKYKVLKNIRCNNELMPVKIPAHIVDFTIDADFELEFPMKMFKTQEGYILVMLVYFNEKTGQNYRILAESGQECNLIAFISCETLENCEACYLYDSKLTPHKMEKSKFLEYIDHYTPKIKS